MGSLINSIHTGPESQKFHMTFLAHFSPQIRAGHVSTLPEVKFDIVLDLSRASSRLKDVCQAVHFNLKYRKEHIPEG